MTQTLVGARAEYLAIVICVASTSLNLGPRSGTDPNGAQVGWLPQTKTAIGVGGTRYQTFFGDMNGDGRADYIYLQDSGAVSVWQNGNAVDDGPHAGERTWIKEGQVTGGDGTSGYSELARVDETIAAEAAELFFHWSTLTSLMVNP
jgi:hypothetical protein